MGHAFLLLRGASKGRRPAAGRRSSASARPLQWPPPPVPGLVLCIAGGIIRIVVQVVAGEELGGRARRGINALIGGTAHKRERRDCDRDAEPSSVRLIVGMALIRLH
jgi:hypothetical protein